METAATPNRLTAMICRPNRRFPAIFGGILSGIPKPEIRMPKEIRNPRSENTPHPRGEPPTPVAVAGLEKRRVST